jgi:hypothetical protein
MSEELMERIEIVDPHVSHHLYRHFDADGVLLYVGVSFSAFARLAQHRDASHWYSKIANMTIENLPSREKLLLAETRAIQTERPLHNIVKVSSHQHRQISARAVESKVAMVRHVVFRPVYSVAEAAECLSISGARIRALVACGRLGTLSFGDGVKGRMQISGWQIIDFLESLSTASRSYDGGDEP